MAPPSYFATLPVNTDFETDKELFPSCVIAPPNFPAVL